MARRPKRTPWFHDFRKRLHFEAAARVEFGEAIMPQKVGKGWGSEIGYVLAVDVPEYGQKRKLTIRLRNFAEPSLAEVEVDGPTDSPHRRGEKASASGAGMPRWSTSGPPTRDYWR